MNQRKALWLFDPVLLRKKEVLKKNRLILSSRFGRCGRNRRLVTTVALLLLICLVLHNEWLSYYVTSIYWSTPKVGQRILLVADPQLIGYENESPRLGLISRWDSDRYLMKTFNLAVKKITPDLVVFLGDLFDEGSTCLEEDFSKTLLRFREIYRAAEHIPKIYIAGDNDIGGEFPERVKPEKRERFYRFFNNSMIRSDQLFPFFTFFEVFAFDGSYTQLKKGASQNSYTVLLSHVPVLPQRRNFERVFDATNPVLIISAHQHYGLAFKEYEKNLSTFSVSPTDSDSNLQQILLQRRQIVEFQVPTCSYRMGVPNMGFGILTIEQKETGVVYVSFTVLWLPGRYPQLYRYLIVIAFIFAILVIFRLFC